MNRDIAAIVVLMLLASVSAGCDANAKEADPSRAQRANADAVPVTAALHHAIASGEARRVAKYVRYPMARPHPLPPVVGEAGLIARFAEILPPSLVAEINESSPAEWREVGWRGWSFRNGMLWADHEGLLIAKNGMSADELARREQLIAHDRASLHVTLRDYATPVLRWQTERFRVRVDKLADGEYRYASWTRDAALDAKPALVLHNGQHRVEGSAANEYFEWRSGDHTYQLCHLRVMSDQDDPMSLRVTKGKQTLVEQAAMPFYPD